ncbi:MAG: hypothetical protein HDR41_04095 [Lactobacillus sp.]|nr:hypothetical protein [Lactobacillus sp.]
MWRWVFSAIIEERDHFQNEGKEKDKIIDELKKENLRLQRKLDEQQILIESFIKERPEWRSFFDGKDKSNE